MQFPDFTNEQKQRIDYLYGNDFKDITPDDAMLIAQWEQAKALNDAEFQAKISAIEAETQAKVENSREMHEQAMSNLKEMHQAAMKRLESVENGI